MILIIDNYDSFTFNLVDYFHQLGISTHVVRNDRFLEEEELKKYKGLVLSPGPETPKKAGFLLQYLEKYHSTLPILGICLGHQAIGEFFGGKLVNAVLPMHGKISTIIHQEAPLFEGIPTHFKAVRYHSLILKNLKEPLEVIAESESGEIMAIRHISLPITGIQYHPESILTEFGLTILKNWINLLNIEPQT